MWERIFFILSAASLISCDPSLLKDDESCKLNHDCKRKAQSNWTLYKENAYCINHMNIKNWKENMTVDSCVSHCIEEGKYWSLWSPNKEICNCCHNPPEETDNPLSKLDNKNNPDTTTNIYQINGHGPPYRAMGKGELCPSGYEITSEEECRLVMKKWRQDLGIKLKSSVIKSMAFAAGSWNVLPYQCSYRAGGDNSFYFNKKKIDKVRSFLNGSNKMICKRDIKSN